MDTKIGSIFRLLQIKQLLQIKLLLKKMNKH